MKLWITWRTRSWVVRAILMAGAFIAWADQNMIWVRRYRTTESTLLIERSFRPSSDAGFSTRPSFAAS